MLVLTRKTNQKIYIGDCIVLTVVQIGPDAVRLGFVAPPDVAIVRDDARKQEPKERTTPQ